MTRATLHRLAILTLVLTVFTLQACRGEHAAPQHPAPVRTALAEPRDTPMILWSVGSVRGSNSVSVKSRQDGRIIKIHFLDGDEVHAGDLLFTIDPVSQALAQAQAKAGLASDRASAEMAVKELDRYKTLYAQGAVSKDEFDQRRTAAETALAQVRSSQAAVGISAQTLSYTFIRSPIDGRIGIAKLDEGNLALANQDVLAVINTIAPIDLDFSLPERYLEDVRLAFRTGPVQVIAATRGGKPVQVKGSLRAIDNSINPATGMFNMRARFENTDEILWPGQFVSAGVVLSTIKGAVLVPAQAVQRGPDGDFVYRVSEGKAEPVAVKVGIPVDDHVVLDSGLKVGDEVVVEGQIRLYPGAPVVQPTPGKPAGASS
ncbi:efflux RND transporter periplasmic adaptor subunit [Desulfovibrio aminophilus]|nr:efflux RND transporter periplasmic adaptor subunit [Desulfovibrio aminophilus]MCM0755155.1 efflux RND transporter periplasmic adaptor subunit [Desulfovibrio aminophilus]